MGKLQEHEFESTRCTECGVNAPVGPCAACEAMICGACGILTKDPNGTKCICHSCARLIADVGERRPRGAKTSTVTVALLLLAGVAVIGLAAIRTLL